jgi:hypothetical protein
VGRHCGRLLGALALLWSLSGCAATGTYHWGGYDRALYAHYKKPQERAAFAGELRRIVAEAEEGTGKIPPGLYAECGFALWEAGDPVGAVAFFKKESALWPESRFLMERMIRNAERKGGAKGPGAQGRAGPAEGAGGEGRS